MKILVVDDSSTHRRLIKLLLARLGIKDVLEAGNGQEAMARVGEADLILTDWNMDVMDGIEFTKKVRASGKQVPIVLITSNNANEDLAEAKKAGVNDYLTKPFFFDHLKNTLKKYLTLPETRETSETEFLEKRKYVRYPSTLQLFVEHGGKRIECLSDNISLEGIKISAPESFREGESVALEIHFIDDIFKPLAVNGVVKWCSPKDEPAAYFETGIFFKDLPSQHLFAVKCWLQIKKGIDQNQFD